MLENKKYFWLLIAIPLYFFYCVLLESFFDIEYSLLNIVFLSAFIISLTIVLAFKRKVYIIISIFLFQLGLVAIIAFLGKDDVLLKRLMYIYSLFYLPELSLIIHFKSLIQDAQDEKKHKNNKQHGSYNTLIFDYLIIVIFVLFIKSLIDGKEEISVKFDSVAVIFLILFILITLYAVFSFKLKIKEFRLRLFSLLLLISCLLEFSVYLIWANQHVQDRVYLSFPVSITIIVVFEYFAGFVNSGHNLLTDENN